MIETRIIYMIYKYNNVYDTYLYDLYNNIYKIHILSIEKEI